LVVQSTNQVDFSLVRGMSANGEWLVTSRAVGASLQLTLLSVGSNGPGELIGTITDSDPYDPYPVAISDDGDTAVFDGRRWERASSSVSPLIPPEPGAVLLRRSRDGRNSVWEVPTQPELYVVDGLTDEVLGWDDLGLEGPDQGSSRSGRFEAGGNAVYDRADGSSRSFAPALAAIDPIWDPFPQSVSNDGSVVLLLGQQFQLGGVFTPSKNQWWTYDLDSGALTPVADNGFNMLNHELVGEVSNDGRVVFAGVSGYLPGYDRLTGVEPDGTERVFQQGSVIPYLSTAPTYLFVGSEDLRTVAYSAFTSQLPPTATLYVARCA